MLKKIRAEFGGISIALLWSIVFFIVIIACVFILEVYFMNVKAEIAKDAVTMAALSVYKSVDINQLQMGNIEVSEDMINTFKIYLAKNMNLNSNLTARPNSIAVGQVLIEDFKIYTKDSKEKYYPNGQIIYYKPSLFVKIKFDIEPILKGILGNKKTVYTSAVVDLIYEKK